MDFDQFMQVRQDPERWEKFLRRRVGLKGEPNSHAAKERASKKQTKRRLRLERRAWEIALLIYLRPEWKPFIEAEFNRILAIIEGRDQWRRQRLEKKREDIS
jgi:hypothetical protein